MSSINWPHTYANPVKTLRVIVNSTLRSIPAILRTLSPSYPLGLRAALARVWLGVALEADAEFIFVGPATHDTQQLTGCEYTTYVLPSSGENEIKNADVVVLYGHGGGLVLGHPLQYLDTYKRWIAKGKQLGLKIVFVAMQYPLGTSQKWPAQRTAYVNTYKHLLQNLSIPSTKIVFAGDSAGSGLATLSLLYLNQQQKQYHRLGSSSTDSSEPLPLPAGNVMISPAIEMSGTIEAKLPNVQYDFIFGFEKFYPVMSELLRPEGQPLDTPELSALRWDSADVKGLVPQLVFWSETEVWGVDGKRWAEKCRQLGVEVQEIRKRGELHVFAIGWPYAGARTEIECDEVLLKWLAKTVDKH